MEENATIILQQQIDYLGVEVSRLRNEVDALTMRLREMSPKERGFGFSAPSISVSQVLSGEKRKPDNYDKIIYAFRRMSPRHHAAMQMLIRGADNKQIGDRFGVGESGAKTYVWGLYKHLGIAGSDVNNKRMMAMGMVKATLDVIGEEEYLRIAGIPKDWDARYEEVGPEWEHVFERTSRARKEAAK